MNKMKLLGLAACAMLGSVSMVNAEECVGPRVAAGKNSWCTADGIKGGSALDKVTRKLQAGLWSGPFGDSVIWADGYKTSGVLSCSVQAGVDGSTQSTTCPTGTVSHAVHVAHIVLE